jgi:serine/threonine protein kinase
VRSNNPFKPLLLLPLLLLAGRGAYGSVYKALDRSSGQVVAVKVISTTDSDEDDLTRIHKEVGSWLCYLQQLDTCSSIGCVTQVAGSVSCGKQHPSSST